MLILQPGYSPWNTGCRQRQKAPRILKLELPDLTAIIDYRGRNGTNESRWTWNGFLASPWIVAVDRLLALPIMNDFDAPKIWFVRHAESEANVQRIYANNSCSFPLTANGLQNAQTLARLLSFVPIRAIYTSPLLRATQTAEQICKVKKIEMQVAPELSEY